MARIKSIKINFRIIIYILTISIVFFGSLFILLRSLNYTIDKNSDKIINASIVMKEKESELINNIKDRKNLTFVINGKIINLDLNKYKLLKDDTHEEIKFESEKVIENMWFLSSKDKYLNAVNDIKNISRNLFLVKEESVSFNLEERISLADLIISTSNLNGVEEVLINPFYNLKLAF